MVKEKLYDPATIEIIRLHSSDVIVTSTASGDDLDSDAWDEV